MDKEKYSHWYYKYKGELVKKLKPCLPGNYIHVHKWDGCYRVEKVSVYGFDIKKNGEMKFLPWEEFKCLKGEGTSKEREMKLELRRLQTYLRSGYMSVTKILGNL